jgi:hypothetical protein
MWFCLTLWPIIKKHALDSKGKMDGEGFYTQFHGVVLFHGMNKNIEKKKVMCDVWKKVNWYCSTYDNTMVYFGVCFVKLHST